MALAAAVGSVPSVASGQTPPPKPSIAPAVAYPRELDQNANRVDDLLDNQLALAAPSAMAEPVRVQLIFSGPVTQAQIDRFVALGGNITYLYKATSYGWNGTIPLEAVMQARNSMGADLLIVCSDRMAYPTLYEATRNGRVRSIWATTATSNGYLGSPNTTIAILDTGLDGTHTDLFGRQAWWHDYTNSGMASPVDYGGHGSHVAGIATGTGASCGVSPTSLNVTYGADMTGLSPGYGYFQGFHVPAGAASAAMTAVWRGGGNTSLYWASSTDGGGALGAVGYVSGSSPLTLSTSYTASATTRYGSFLGQNSSSTITLSAVYGSVAFKGIGDGFSPLSGVAPEAKWAGCKVFQNDSGTCYLSDVGAAIDDMVARRKDLNIKVMNLSLGGDLYSPIRTQINNAVANGIVVAVAMGNDGPSASVGDPQSAAKAITIAASNDHNQLTDYTSAWAGSLVTGQDYKPDVMAPGGSSYYSAIMSVDSNSADADSSSFPDQQTNDYTPMMGTSMASPFVAGCSALVIQALEDQGVVWDFDSSNTSLLVKMLLCATATESNQNREGGTNNPTLGRAAAPKDFYEGYGMINPDTAIDAVRQLFTWGNPLGATTNGGYYDARAWARHATLASGTRYNLSMTCPATGDYDLYLYSKTPDANGNPVILASSCNAGLGQPESIAYDATIDRDAYLVVKRVAGNGAWSATSTMTASTAYTISSVTFSPSSVLGGSTTTGTVTLPSQAPSDGITIGLASSNSSIATVPTKVTVPAGQTSATFTVQTAGVPSSTSVTVTATFGANSKTGSLSVNPLSVTSVTLARAGIEGGAASTGTVTLNGPAPTGGSIVTLSSSKTTLARVPASATVPQGSTSATFSITTYKVSTTDSTTISAVLGSTGSQSATLGVYPVTKLSSIAVSPNPIDAGSNATGTVSIATPAIPGGCLVTLTNSKPAYYTVPTTVTVPEGATSATFSVNVPQDSIGASGYVTASHAGSANVTVVIGTNARKLKSLVATPNPVVGGQACSATVTISVAAPAGGYVVSLTSSKPATLVIPSSVTVPEGATTASFSVGTVEQTVGDSAYLTASHAGSANAQVTIRVTPAQLASLSANPNPMPAGGTCTGTVTIGTAAPSAGYVVTLKASNASLLSVPATVTIPAGSTSVTFAIKALVSGTGGLGYITASHAGSVNKTVVVSSTK